MKKKELREIIREVIIQEFRIDKSIESKVDEFGELSDEIDRVKNNLGDLKKRYKVLEDQLRPIFDELEDFEEKSLRTQKYLVSIKRSGYERINYKYKEVFETSLTKVNKQTRDLLKDLLDETKSITQVVTSIGVQKVDEGNLFKDLFRKIKQVVRSILPTIRKTNKSMDDLLGISQKILRSN